ncbi:TetR/AcrR family transcriptional regulator [Streptomyces sp. NPDC046909]|uniref:TetR/AcrR family transcriptional regulator n=1 Tax=Streptomyces sp. NPDC046909 TaxID=3155617 RepID=UPI00340AD82C
MPTMEPCEPSVEEALQLIGDWRVFEPLELPATLTGALDAFREHGYHGTSVRDIARRVGVTVPALYYHHENKQAMLVALLEHAVGEALARARLADAAGEGWVLERFANVTECIVLHMTHRAATAGLDAELRYLEPANRKRYAALRKQLEEMVLAILEEGVAQGLFEVDHAPDTVRALLGMWQAVATWYHDGGPLSPQEIANRYVSISLRAVGARVRPAPRTHSAA